MDENCTIIYSICNFDCYKQYVNYYVDSTGHIKPFLPDQYCIYLASSITILRKYVTSHLPYTSSFKYRTLKKNTLSPAAGIKYLVDERYDKDVKTIRDKRPNIRRLIYIDLTQLVACYVSNSHTFSFDYVFNLLCYYVDGEPCVIRLTYRCHDSDDIRVKTVDNTSEILKIFDECKETVDYYRSNMVKTIAYCMVNCTDLSTAITLCAVEQCNIDIKDLDKSVKSYMRM